MKRALVIIFLICLTLGGATYATPSTSFGDSEDTQMDRTVELIDSSAFTEKDSSSQIYVTEKSPKKNKVKKKGFWAKLFGKKKDLDAEMKQYLDEDEPEQESDEGY